VAAHDYFLKLSSAFMRWTNYGDEIMRRISKSVASWLSIESERGVTAIEYGLIASLVALAIIVGVTALGTQLGAMFSYIATQVTPPS
jgi:pilus assembly protein Flp/PilA